MAKRSISKKAAEGLKGHQDGKKTIRNASFARKERKTAKEQSAATDFMYVGVLSASGGVGAS